jgi:hypothetical protein
MLNVEMLMVIVDSMCSKRQLVTGDKLAGKVVISDPLFISKSLNI